jgi:peptidyl-prolyl cis-trans isomerase A (cyclophilin A)
MHQLAKFLSFIKFPIRFYLFALASAVMLVSCGGGGGTPTYTVGGTVSGLTSGSLVLKNNAGDALTISANSTSFTFTTAQVSGSTYAVAVGIQPSGLACSVANGGGTIASANVTGVTITCIPTTYVTDIQVDRLSYSRTSNFKIIGTVLSAGTALALSADKCSSITVLNTSTDTEVNVSCTVNATGTLTFLAKDTSGTTLLTKTMTVPEPQVTIVTSLGTLVLELNPTLAPLSVNNYLQYVHDGFYTNTLFHRVGNLSGSGVPQFAQGGQYTAAPAEQTGVRAAIANEGNNGLSNVRGTIAMARTSAMHSATAQFYFNVTDNAAALGQTGNEYAVFGKLTQGLTVLDAIGNSATGPSVIEGNALASRPLVDIVLQSVTQTQ